MNRNPVPNMSKEALLKVYSQGLENCSKKEYLAKYGYEYTKEDLKKDVITKIIFVCTILLIIVGCMYIA